MKVTQIYTNDAWTDCMCPSIEQSICFDQQIAFNVVTDRTRAMYLSEGKINPNGGYVCEVDDGTVIRDYFELVHWIEDKGLKQV